MIEMVGLNLLALHLQHLARVVRPTMIVPVAASESPVPVSMRSTEGYPSPDGC